jgi:hypothetical protein
MALAMVLVTLPALRKIPADIAANHLFFKETQHSFHPVCNLLKVYYILKEMYSSQYLKFL